MAKKPKIQKQVTNWVTKSGTKMRICDMEASHLINSLNLPVLIQMLQLQ